MGKFHLRLIWHLFPLAPTHPHAHFDAAMIVEFDGCRQTIVLLSIVDSRPPARVEGEGSTFPTEPVMWRMQSNRSPRISPVVSLNQYYWTSTERSPS